MLYTGKSKSFPYGVVPYSKNSDRIRRYERFSYAECIARQVWHFRLARTDCRRFYVCECPAGSNRDRRAREQQEKEPDDSGCVRHAVLLGGVFAAGGHNLAATRRANFALRDVYADSRRGLRDSAREARWSN